MNNNELVDRDTARKAFTYLKMFAELRAEDAVKRYEISSVRSWGRVAWVTALWTAVLSGASVATAIAMKLSGSEPDVVVTVFVLSAWICLALIGVHYVIERKLEDMTTDYSEWLDYKMAILEGREDSTHDEEEPASDA